MLYNVAFPQLLSSKLDQSLQQDLHMESNTHFPLHNEEALERIKKEKNRASVKAELATGAGTLFPPVGFTLFYFAYNPLERVKKLSQVEWAIEQVLQRFNHLTPLIFPSVETDTGTKPIDLFVHFPKKTNLIISIRSKGESKIVYNESREILQVKRKKAGLALWQPCPLVELAEYKNWLNRNRQVFNLSSRDIVKTPTARILVLWPPTSIHTHKDQLYSNLGTSTPLALNRKGTAFVVEKRELLNLITAWIARYE